MLHFCHITNLTGQIFPVQNLARMARARGIITIVDGAHAVAHFPFKLRDLEMDYYGTSLHKWLLAPTGTGFLYVRRDRIAKTWPMQAAPERSDNDIRKFEEIGTSPAATKAAINEALAFHQAIGTERVAARLRYLTLRWANKLKANPRVQIHTGLDQVYGVCVRRHQGHSRAAHQRVHVGQVPDHHHGDQPARIQRHPRDAEHLHAARGDRHVHGGDGGSAEERGARDRVTPESSSRRLTPEQQRAATNSRSPRRRSVRSVHPVYSRVPS